MIEKRTLPRFAVPIRLEYQKLKVEERFPALALDISMKGAKLKTQELLKSEDILDLFFYFPNRPPQEAVGKVIWTKESSYFLAGLYFLNIRDSLKESIFEYVFRYFPQEIQNKWWKDF